jgi:hypothetical protein
MRSDALRSFKRATNRLGQARRGDDMELETPTLATLFEQLGLDSDQESIDAFVEQHGPLPDDVKVSEAKFWTPQQGDFLKELLLRDDDWAPIVDELNALLHAAK